MSKWNVTQIRRRASTLAYGWIGYFFRVPWVPTLCGSIVTTYTYSYAIIGSSNGNQIYAHAICDQFRRLSYIASINVLCFFAHTDFYIDFVNLVLKFKLFVYLAPETKTRSSHMSRANSLFFMVMTYSYLYGVQLWDDLKGYLYISPGICKAWFPRDVNYCRFHISELYENS